MSGKTIAELQKELADRVEQFSDLAEDWHASLFWLWQTVCDTQFSMCGTGGNSACYSGELIISPGPRDSAYLQLMTDDRNKLEFYVRGRLRIEEETNYLPRRIGKGHKKRTKHILTDEVDGLEILPLWYFETKIKKNTREDLSIGDFAKTTILEPLLYYLEREHTDKLGRKLREHLTILPDDQFLHLLVRETLKRPDSYKPQLQNYLQTILNIEEIATSYLQFQADDLAEILQSVRKDL